LGKERATVPPTTRSEQPYLRGVCTVKDSFQFGDFSIALVAFRTTTSTGETARREQPYLHGVYTVKRIPAYKGRQVGRPESESEQS